MVKLLSLLWKNFHAILCGWLVVVVAIDLFLSA